MLCDICVILFIRFIDPDLSVETPAVVWGAAHLVRGARPGCRPKAFCELHHGIVNYIILYILCYARFCTVLCLICVYVGRSGGDCVRGVLAVFTAIFTVV